MDPLKYPAVRRVSLYNYSEAIRKFLAWGLWSHWAERTDRLAFVPSVWQDRLTKTFLAFCWSQISWAMLFWKTPPCNQSVFSLAFMNWITWAYEISHVCLVPFVRLKCTIAQLRISLIVAPAHYKRLFPCCRRRHTSMIEHSNQLEWVKRRRMHLFRFNDLRRHFESHNKHRWRFDCLYSWCGDKMNSVSR